MSSERNITNFAVKPLNLAYIREDQIKQFYTWKASANRPLLVYDPEHKGIVKDGSQLFGNYTEFNPLTPLTGGTPDSLPSLSREGLGMGSLKTPPLGGWGASSSQTAPVKGAGGFSPPWKNGYEALAMLDTNHDLEISGKELKPLSLWFDYNEDGISQKGEVQDIREAGITKLFFETSYCDLETGDIHANVGYERIVNGKEETGASVDWYAEGPFDTKEEAMVGKEYKEYIVGVGFVYTIKTFEGRN